MSSYNTIETPQDYVNYTFNITSRGITEVTGELAGLSNTVTTILGQLAFKTSEYLTHTESLMISMGAVSAASFVSATKEAIKFEQAIANVQAIGGESINAMQIGQAAMQYSNQFGMDVNSMTEGLEALSRAGLSATNVMSGVLAEGVKLSKLEGMDLEDSINDLISSTNLLAETDIDVNSQEYANAVKAMNQHIVSTSESAPINAQNIMQSLQHVGGYVSSNKIDQDDLFAVIAQLGAKGTKGEMAGTALRAFVAAGQKDQAQRALSRIGLDVSDLWDESGEAMLPISEMKDVLDNALEAHGYSKQEKLEFYADFVGYKQANQIMKIDSTEVQQYKETIAHAWDLGKKLDTILGTTHNNMQILFQTIKNFMTKVGQSTLPILNAIVTPIKWGVQLLDAMPFSENITGMILAFGTLKAILLVINRVVPSIASMYTSFSSGEEKAKGIAGHFKNMYNDLTKSYDILTHITDSKYLSKIRVAEGFMGQQSYKQHQYVTQEIYKLYTQDNPNADKWFELAPIERELFESLTEAMKDTEVYKNIEGKYKEKSQKEALNIITFMENPQRASVTYGESKQDINKKVAEKTQANNDAVNASQQLKNEVRDFAQELNNSLIKKAETQEEKDITSAILNTKEALAEAIGRSVAQSFRTREVEVSKDLGSFEIDKRVSSGAIKQLQEIEAQVSNELGDIGYFLKDDIDAIDNLISTVRYDLQQKISAYSNTNPSYMNHVQEQRMEKSISRAAKTNLGLLYSSEQNNIDILNVLRNNKWNRPQDSRLGIRDAQMDAIEEALHMDSGAGKDRDTRLTKIHNELQSKYEGKEKEAKIAEILEKTEAIWLKAEKEKEVPSVVASRHLTDARAQHIGNAIGLGGFNWAQIDNAADVLTEYFKDAKTNPKKQQELKRADKMLFSFLEEAKGAGEVFNAAEVEELGYLIRRYKQLMAARVQAEEKANKSFATGPNIQQPISNILETLSDDTIAEKVKEKIKEKYDIKQFVVPPSDIQQRRDMIADSEIKKQSLSDIHTQAYAAYIGGYISDAGNKYVKTGENGDLKFKDLPYNTEHFYELQDKTVAEVTELALEAIEQSGTSLMQNTVLYHGRELSKANQAGFGLFDGIRSLTFNKRVATGFARIINAKTGKPDRYRTMVYTPQEIQGATSNVGFGGGVDFTVAQHRGEEEYTVGPQVFLELMRNDEKRRADILLVPLEDIIQILNEIDNKSFDKSGGWMNPSPADIGPKQAYRENIKNGGGFYPNEDLSQFSWKDNFENFMQTAIITAFDAPARNRWGASYGSTIEINPSYIKDTSQAFFSDTLNTLLHESAHSILQHQERDIDTTSSLYIGNSESEWRGREVNVIAELEASMVANLAMQKMGIDVEKDQIRQTEELSKLWRQMGEPEGLLSFADLNHLADEMANHVNDFVQITRTLMDVANSQEVLSNMQPSNVLTEKEKAKLADIENRFASIRKKRTGFATGPSFNPDDDIINEVANKIFKEYDEERRKGPSKVGQILRDDFPDVTSEYARPIWDAVRDLMKNEAESKAQSASDTLTLNETVFNKGIEKILNKMDDMTNVNAIDIQIPLLDKLLNNQLIEKENYDKALLSLSDTLTSTINGTPAGQNSQLDDVKDKLDKILENTEEDAALRKAMLERLMHLNEKEPSSLNQSSTANSITAYGQTITVYGHVVDNDENMSNNDILQLTTSIYKILPALTKTNIDDAISKIELFTQLQNILNNKNLALPAYNDGNFIPPHQFTEEEIKNIRAFTLYCMTQISKAQQQIENDIESSAFAVELMSKTMHLHDVLSSPLESGSSDKLPNFANEKGVMSILAILPALHTLMNNIDIAESAESAENVDDASTDKKSNFIDLSKVTLVQDAYPNFIMQNDPGLIQKILILEMLKTFPVSSLSNVSQYSTPAKNEDNYIYPIINGFNLLFENIRYWIANIFNPITQSLPFENDIVIDTNTIEIKTRPAIDITSPHFDYLDMMQAELAQQNSSLIGSKTKTQIAQAIYKNPFSITREDLVHAGMQDRIEEWEQNKNIMANPVNKKIVNAMEKITENEYAKYQQSQIPSLTRTEAEKMVMENPFKITEEDLKFLGMDDLIQTLHQNRDTINRRYQRQSNEEYSNIYSDPLEDYINAIEEVNKTLYDEDFLNTFTKENKEFVNKLSEIANDFINKQETLNERTINAIQPFLEKTLSDNQKEMNQHTKTTPKDTTTFQNNQFRTNTNIGVQNLKHSYKNAGMISIMDAEGNELNMDELIDEVNERDTILQSLLEADKNATEIGNKIKDDIQKRNEFLRDRILASNENVKQMAQEMYALDYAKDPSSVPDYILDILGWQSAEGKEAERKRQKEQKFKSKDKGIQNRIAEQQAQNAKQNQEDFINLSNFAQSEMPTMEEKNQKRLKEDIIAARRIDEDRAEQAYIQEHVGPDIEALKRGQEQANAQIEQEYNRQRVQADIDSLKLKQQQLEQEEKFLENQKDLLNVAQQVTETVQKQKQEEEFLNAQKDLLNISNTITQQQNATAGLKNLDKTIEEAQIAKQKEQEQQAISNAGKMFNDFDEYQKQFRILSKVNEDIEKNRAGYKVKNTAKDIRQFIDDAPGKGISLLGNLLGVSSKGMTHKDIKEEAEENDYLGKTSAKITKLHESLKPFNQALHQAGEIFPPFTIAAATMSKTMSALTMVAGALNFIEQLRLALLGEEYIAEEGSLAAKLLGIAATWAASNSEAALTGARIIGQIETWKTAISETVLGAIRAFINGPLLLPIIAILAAIAATLATLYFWEKQHANALKETQEQLQKATAENNIAMSQYKDLKKAREAETDAIKRQQKARKEAIALYELEASRVKRRRLVHEEANLRNDAVWGEYGLRAAMQKMGLGFIAGGDFQSQYEQYDGTTKNIRQIKEETIGNLFATSEQRQVASVYDNNKHFFAEVEAYKEPLQALYDTESKLIEQYGSIDDARASKEFYDAVQDFADATGINGKTAAKMLDWLETENKVNQATQAMQAQADVIVARADAKALAAEVGSDDFSDEGLQNAMIYAQASSIYQDAYDKLWWDWFGNTLFYILYSMLNTMSLGFGWGKETSEYAQKQEAYAEGMRELAELGVAGLAEVGENTAEHAERRDYGNGGGVNYGDTPFSGAKAAMAESYADQKQKEDYQKYGVVYSNDEYNDLQENHDVYLHSHLQASVNDSLAQEKTYVDNETQALEQSLNQGMNQAGQQGVQGFKDGLDQHSPGAISRSVQDEMIYSSDFIVAATPQLSKDTQQLGIQMSNSHQDSLTMADNTQKEMDNVDKAIKDSKDIINPTAYDAGYEAGQEYGKGFEKGLEDLYSQISSPEALEKTLRDRILVRQGYGTPEGADPNDPEVQELQERRRQETESKLIARGFDLPSLGGFAKSEAKAAYRVAKSGGLRSWKDASVIGRIANAAEIGITEKSVSKGLKALFSPKYGEEFGVQGGKHAIKKMLGIEATETVAKAPTGKIVGAVDDALGVARGKGGKYVEKGLSKLGIEGTEGVTEGITKFVAKNFGDDAAKFLVKGGSKLAKAGAKAVPFVGTAITAATSIAEHNPFEKHYNEDGTEKRAFQSSGEVLGEIGGALASDVIGAVFGPVAGMAAGLVLEPIGEAIGGTWGWIADEVVNTDIKDIFAGGNALLGGVPGQIFDMMSNSPIGDIGRGIWGHLDNLTGGWLGDTWENVQNSSIAELTGLDQLGGALQGLGEWLFGTGEEENSSEVTTDDTNIDALQSYMTGSNFMMPYALEMEERKKKDSWYRRYNEFAEGKQDFNLALLYGARNIFDMMFDTGGFDIYKGLLDSDNLNILHKQFQESISETPQIDDISIDKVGQKMPTHKAETSIIIKNININTEDDPEKIKSALMNLIIEMQEQVSPRQVSRTVGEPPSVSTDASTDTNNQDQAEGQDEQNANGNTNTNNNPTT